MSSGDLRDLFEACKTGDLNKVKKLLTPHNVNEIGEKTSSKEHLEIVVNLEYFQIMLGENQQHYISLVVTEEKTWLNICLQTVQTSLQEMMED